MKRKSSFRENKKVKIAKRGNWCGGGWTAGQAKDASDMTPADYNVPALSSQDQNCKAHDIALYEAETKEDVERAHEEFYVNSADTFEGRVQSKLVYLFGPTNPNPNKRKHKAVRRDHLQKSKKLRGSMGRFESLDPKHYPKPNNPGPSTEPLPRGAEPVAADPGMPRGVTAAAVAPSGGRGQTNNQGETHVDMLPTFTYLPFKHTQQCFMKFRQQNTMDLAAGTVGSTSCVAHTFRLNSIYDVRSEYGFIADPAAAADAADTTINTPHMRAYWMNFYRYWTVTKSYYRVKIWTTTKSTTGEIYVYAYKHGQQHPPCRNYLADTRIQHFVRKNHPNVSYIKVHTPNSTETDYNLYEDKVGYFEGTWSPGSISNTIAEDEYSETWHKATEVPSHRQLLTIMCQRSERAENIAYSLTYEIEMVFEVQLKDLKAEHEFVTSDSAIPAIAGYCAQQN
jgi:hypothetical protein